MKLTARPLTGLVATLCVLFSVIPAGHTQAAAWVPPGPAVGSAFPDALDLLDQTGKRQSLKALTGTKGAAIFFVRSADWCPFCKKQLADVNERLAEFKSLGLNVVSVSHDEVALIAAFHHSQSIGYTMLADPNGTVVEKLGIRDLQYADGTKAHGVARPMIFVVTPQLKVTHKYAEESYRNRPDLNKVLAELR
jgi:peroxiredoxin